MSFLFSNKSSISLSDTGIGDAFGRLRISEPQTIFDSQLQYDKQSFLWDEKIVGTASSTHLPFESSVQMNVGANVGDRIVRQTREYFRYQPGKSQLIFMTYSFDTFNPGVRKLVGYGDDENGIFVGRDDDGLFMMLRSNATGTVDDSRKIYQQDWNVDKMDGNGPSRFILNPNVTQIFLTDIEWLGVGRVRVGFVIDGLICYVHDFNNANSLDRVYMTTANLPCRYELVNLAGQTTGIMKQICTQVSSEGGVEELLAYPHSSSVVNVPIPSGESNAIVVFAIRHKQLFNGITNRANIIPKNFEITSSGELVVSRVIYNPTIVGTWSDQDPNSIVEIATNEDVTSWSGGQVISTAINPAAPTGPQVRVASNVLGRSIASKLPIGLDIDGDNPIAIAIVSYAVGGTATASYTFEWDEIR